MADLNRSSRAEVYAREAEITLRFRGPHRSAAGHFNSSRRAYFLAGPAAVAVCIGIKPRVETEVPGKPVYSRDNGKKQVFQVPGTMWIPGGGA